MSEAGALTVQSLRLHAELASVQEAGLGVLAHLTSQPVLQHALLLAGAVPISVAAVNTHASNAGVLAQAIYVLANLMGDANEVQEGLANLAARLAVQAMRDHPKALVLQSNAASLLGSLARKDSTRRAVGGWAHAGEVARAALATFPEDAIVQVPVKFGASGLHSVHKRAICCTNDESGDVVLPGPRVPSFDRAMHCCALLFDHLFKILMGALRFAAVYYSNRYFLVLKRRDTNAKYQANKNLNHGKLKRSRIAGIRIYRDYSVKAILAQRPSCTLNISFVHRARRPTVGIIRLCWCMIKRDEHWVSNLYVSVNFNYLTT